MSFWLDSKPIKGGDLNNYELAAILDPNLAEGDVEKISTELSSLLTNSGATNILNIKTERRTFAYPIRKHREGTYLFIDFQAPSTVPEKMRRELLHREEILRLAFFRLPDERTAETQTQSFSNLGQPGSEEPSAEVKDE